MRNRANYLCKPFSGPLRGREARKTNRTTKAAATRNIPAIKNESSGNAIPNTQHGAPQASKTTMTFTNTPGTTLPDLGKGTSNSLFLLAPEGRNTHRHDTRHDSPSLGQPLRSQMVYVRSTPPRESFRLQATKISLLFYQNSHVRILLNDCNKTMFKRYQIPRTCLGSAAQQPLDAPTPL